MSEKSSNKKVVFIIIFAIMAIILAYAFSVIYFFFISPNNISMRLKIFPLLSTETIAEQYLDAVVEIDFTAKAENDISPEEEVEVFGVNVREDGYVIASYHEFYCYYEFGSLSVISNEGGVYNGEIIFADETYNVVIIKLLSSSGKDVSLPFVNVYSDEISEGVSIVSVQVEYKTVRETPIRTTTIASGETYDGYGTAWYLTDFSGYTGIDYMIEDCFLYSASGETENSFIFNKYGSLMGIYSAYDLDGEYGFATSVSHVASLLDDIVENYENTQSAYSSGIISALVALDAEEVYLHSEIALTEASTSGYDEDGYSGHYYFNGEWLEFSDSMNALLSTTVQDYENYEFKWLYLVEDFTYGDVFISKDSILTEIEINGQSTTISSKLELVNLLYQLESGDEIKIHYYSNYALSDETTETEVLSFIF